MSNSIRTKAIDTIAQKSPMPTMPAKTASVDFYAEDVFNCEAMREYLPKDVCEKLFATINDGVALDPSIAGEVAHAMKHWAIERGATHYTHWFQPLTGTTAEKHDSFVEPEEGKAIMAFSGKNLIVSEPDASSFPSGGLRCTFEARGYTAWDPTSPAFIKRNGNGATLCIPTAFCSYTGEALDKKTPLLRSTQALKNAVRRMMKCFGREGEKIAITLGAEQEYFLIDKSFYLHRPDLLQTGRTLFGASPAKHQQLEDHYFGSIKSRILDFMSDVEVELWKLGIPAKTRHNEVAPAQFELAPLFEDVNLACDHNMLIMEVLRMVADRYGLVCLLHEKPFAGINGSGKHNNWSISFGKTNLLDPGKDPHQNAIFLTTLCSVIAGVDNRADLLRSTVASAGNDHRLGAQEAPPAVISMYLGDQLNDIINQIEQGEATTSLKGGKMRIGVDSLPALPRDATDRNRTSPFAFTGNKFEFRAPGSSQTSAGPMMVLNTIVAEAMDALSEKIEAFDSTADFNTQLQALLTETIRKHKRIIFNGNGYSEEWLEEAAKRGLPNLKNTPEALKVFNSPSNTALFAKYGVFSQREVDSRQEVFVEEYNTRVHIEGQIGSEMVSNIILPVVVEQYGKTVKALTAAKASGIKAGVTGLTKLVETLGEGIDEINTQIESLNDLLANDGCPLKVIDNLKSLRAVVDRLEGIVDDDKWPLPKYREMLFIY